MVRSLTRPSDLLGFFDYFPARCPQEPLMNRKLVFAVATAAAALLSLSAYAQTAADVQRVSKIIGGDPAKKAAYCEIGKLGQQMEEADKKKDNKALEALGKKADDLA